MLFHFLPVTNTFGEISDTTWSVEFRVNMTSAIEEQIFRPDSDAVYVVTDHGLPPYRLVANPGNYYSWKVEQVLDSGETYNFRFRINDTIFETVERTVVAGPGNEIYSGWWNDIAPGNIDFVVNMQFAIAAGMFNPQTDVVNLTGTMNGLNVKKSLERIGTSEMYSVIAGTDPGARWVFKFQINEDPSGFELDGKPARLTLGTDSISTFRCDFDNYNPGKRPMVFRCNMSYYIRSLSFSPENQYLDVSGNFSSSGEPDLLFDIDGDSVYTLEKYLDTLWYSAGPLSFRFRINGDDSLAELTGKPARSYAFHDTVNQNPNIYSCYYNDLDPTIPTRPWAENLEIQGYLGYKHFLTGSYTYRSVNGIPEGVSTYRWLKSQTASGLDAVPIDSADNIVYQVDTLDIGYYLVFEVTPKALAGDSSVGIPARVVSADRISAWDLGIPNQDQIHFSLFPNPVSRAFSIIAEEKLELLLVCDFTGRVVMEKRYPGMTRISMEAGNLPTGMYIVRVTGENGRTGVSKFIKL